MGFDPGDIVGVDGYCSARTGELSVHAEKQTFLPNPAGMPENGTALRIEIVTASVIWI
jgi:hypothetical protein